MNENLGLQIALSHQEAGEPKPRKCPLPADGPIGSLEKPCAERSEDLVVYNDDLKVRRDEIENHNDTDATIRIGDEPLAAVIWCPRELDFLLGCVCLDDDEKF